MTLKTNGAPPAKESAPQLNLFDSSNRDKSTAVAPAHQPAAAIYPFAPGFKGSAETGRDAAKLVAPTRLTREAEVVEALQILGEGTAELIAERTGRHWYTTRPRLSELRAQGRVQDTGRRAPTAMGGHTIVWRLSTVEELAIHRAREAVEAEKVGDAE